MIVEIIVTKNTNRITFVENTILVLYRMIIGFFRKPIYLNIRMELFKTFVIVVEFLPHNLNKKNEWIQFDCRELIDVFLDQGLTMRLIHVSDIFNFVNHKNSIYKSFSICNETRKFSWCEMWMIFSFFSFRTRSNGKSNISAEYV